MRTWRVFAEPVTYGGPLESKGKQLDFIIVIVIMKVWNPSLQVSIHVNLELPLNQQIIATTNIPAKVVATS